MWWGSERISETCNKKHVLASAALGSQGQEVCIARTLGGALHCGRVDRPGWVPCCRGTPGLCS